MEEINKLYEESKDIIHSAMRFNASPEAGKLLENLRALRDIAAENLKS